MPNIVFSGKFKSLAVQDLLVSCKHTFQGWPLLPRLNRWDRESSRAEQPWQSKLKSKWSEGVHKGSGNDDCSSVTFEAEINPLRRLHSPSRFYANAAKGRASPWPLFTALLCVCVAPPDLSQRDTHSHTRRQIAEERDGDSTATLWLHFYDVPTSHWYWLRAAHCCP